MSSNTLNNRSNGETITAEFFNSVHQALNGEVVGRNASGVPAAGQQLGTVALPWGTVRANSMVINGQTIDPAIAAIPQNVVISGAVRSGSSQPLFITPSGSGLSFTVEGAPTALTFDVNGTNVSISTDIVKSSLTAAPSTNNTALINDVDATGQADTRVWGEYGHIKKITIDTVGSEITALVGKWAAFKIGSEYLLGRVRTATEIDQCYRGFFFGPSGQPIKRAAFSNNDTVTLMKLGFIFAENDGATIDVTYNNPSWSFDSPSGPVTGDYWYDLPNQTWKRYDGAAWQVINRTYIGMFVNDTTDCVAARSADTYAKHSDYFEFEVQRQSTEIAVAESTGGYLEVYGENLYFGNVRLPQWNITTDLAASADMYTASEQASTPYYLYVTSKGETVMSDVSPHFRPELSGFYHTHQSWKCVGVAFNGATSNLSSADSISIRNGTGKELFVNLSANLAVVSNDPIIFDEQIVASLGGYDSSTGEFIVGATGDYTITLVGQAAGASSAYLRVNSVTDHIYVTGLSTAINCGSVTRRLQVGDVVTMRIDSSQTISGQSYPTNAALSHMRIKRLR